MEWRLRAFVLVLVVVIVCAGALAANGDGPVRGGGLPAEPSPPIVLALAGSWPAPSAAAATPTLLVVEGGRCWEESHAESASAGVAAAGEELRLTCRRIAVTASDDRAEGGGVAILCQGAVALEGPDFVAEAGTLSYTGGDVLTLTGDGGELAELRVRSAGGGARGAMETVVAARRIVLPAGQRRIRIAGSLVR